MSSQPSPEATRLEQLWSGGFGDAYTDRNDNVAAGRAPFWQQILGTYEIASVLEVGCNLGANLGWLARSIDPTQVYGVDVNTKALSQLRQSLPQVNSVWSVARHLPFRDKWFDLVFTTGVLIHQPEATLPLVMSEIVRCSRRYVLCGEYHAETTVEIPYRDQSGALFKRDYGLLYQELFPELQLRQQGFLGRDQGWDDVTFWLFEKR